MIIVFNYCYKALTVYSSRLINILYTLLFRILLYINKVKAGKSVRTYNAIPQLVISKDVKNVRIGNNVSFNNYNDVGWACKCSIWVRKGAEVVIGDNSGFNGVLLYASNSVTIGNNVKIGGGCRVFDTDFHPLDYKERRISDVNTNKKPIVIEDDVFIGANSIICKGVTIGARSIIGAGSIVVKSIPADCVAAGNPCRIIKRM